MYILLLSDFKSLMLRLKTIEIDTACEVMNYHLLSLTPIDRNLLIKPVRALHEKWFEITAVKDARLQEVRNYLKFFEEFSVNLVKTLMHSVDANGNNVLHYVYGNSRFDLAEELLRSGHATNLLNKLNKSGNSPLMICATSKPKTESDWFVIQKTIQLGDVNASSPFNNQTPLMHAASWGSHGMVRLLLDAGADPNFQDKDGSTALMYAAAHGHIVCARMLLEHPNCDPSIKDCVRETFLLLYKML
ncbi:KN motif and ankyrin repeat domain-containing protein 2-like isoform X1 [Stegodyphus dumicola]|uniref:KN motif and ankyrin repeat domain-containing protein 2-like isoform X1 n=1 Tax=Stegodyphus dumicola TaxID=202533 RepID=UPI0015B04BE4|nr:KN motif and ankyrin repeat domain-containing protein 2-like isoform X1 [Stegodyphus dumicola]